MTIEQKIIQSLSIPLGSGTVPVSGSVPHPMPDVFVTVEKTGESKTNLIPEAQIHLNCWSPTRASAAALCELAVSAMLGLVADSAISSVSLTTSYNNPDLTTDRPRYSAVFQVVYLI